MGRVAEIVVPPPDPFVEGEEGAEARGAGYRFIAPRTATEPLVMEAADGSVFLWTPTELCYRDEHGNIDFIAGSAPVELEVRGREARYRRTFPSSDEVHIAQPDGRKYWLILHERPRDPTSYLQGEIWFGVSGMVGGVPLPPGVHRTMQAFAFDFNDPFAADLMDAQTECWYEVVDTDDGQMLFIWCRADWLLDPDRVFPVKIDPTVYVGVYGISPGPQARRRIVRASNGWLWAMLYVSGQGLVFRYSTDGGESWIAPTNDTISSGSSNAVLDIDDFDQLHVAWSTSTTLVYRWALAATTLNWSSPYTVLDLSGYNSFSFANMHVFTEGDAAYAVLVYSLYFELEYSGRWQSSLGARIIQLQNGSISAKSSLGPYGVESDGAYVFSPVSALDDHHNLHIMAVRTRPNGQFVRLEYWTLEWLGWSATRPYERDDNSYYYYTGSTINWSGASLAVDSIGRVWLFFRGSASPYSLRIWLRETDGTWGEIQAPNLTDLRRIVAVPDPDTGDLYIFFTQPSAVCLLKWSASQGAFSEVEVLASQPTMTDFSTSGWNRGTDVLYAVSGNPATAEYLRFNANNPPQQPTNLSRPAFDATEDAVFTWQHNDDPGDGQAKFQLQLRLAGTDTDLVDTGEVQSPISEYLLPANTLQNGNTYQWRVRTADQSGEWSSWSDYAVFQTGPKPQATILYPTEGTTVSTSDVTVEWSVASQSAATVRLYDGAGQTVLQEHEVTTPSARARTITGLQNNTSYQVSVQPISSIGVQGDEVFSGPFDVAYTPPPKPTATAAGQAGFIRVTITNPAPAVGEPEVTHNDLYRREPGSSWVRIATGIEPDGTHDDYAVGSGVVYEYRVRAVGANGTYTDSDPAEARTTFDEWRFSPVDGRPEIRFRFDSSVSWRPEEDVQVPRTQSRYRRTYRNPAFARVADIQARFRDGEDGLTVREQRERLLQYIEQGVVGWLRGRHGDCWRGVLLQSQVQPSPHFARETVACVFRETREAP